MPYVFIVICMLTFGYCLKNNYDLWKQKDNTALEKKTIYFTFLVYSAMIVFGLIILF